MFHRVRDVMTANPVKLEHTASIAEAARAMRKHDIGDVLVTRDGRLAGIITDRDIVIRSVADSQPTNATIGDLCSQEPVTVGADEPVDAAVALMREHAVRRLPVVENGEPIGVVSLGDLAQEREPRSVLGQIAQAPPNH